MPAGPFRGRGRSAAVPIVAASAWLVCVAATNVRAQSPPEAAADVPPRVALSGDASVTVGPVDTTHYFNFTDYDHNALRIFAATLAGRVRITGQVAVLGELRLENADSLRVSALYARVRPLRRAPIAIQAGRIPPVFGLFARDRYGPGNPLISLPLGYQYLTTLRSDAVPPDADALLSVRGDGWLVRYDQRYGYGGAAAQQYRHGLPLVSGSRWDTGVQITARAPSFEGTFGVTAGSLSEPRVVDSNGGRQLVGRAAWTPFAAWTFGVSAARGEYLTRDAGRTLPWPPANTGPWVQRGLGVDAVFARGYFRARGEIIASGWRVPRVAQPYLDSPLGALASTLELLYRVRPAFDLAARVDHLAFSDVRGTLFDGRATPWDADVTRVEVGSVHRLTEHLRLKLVYQHNWRYDQPRTTAGYPAAQLWLWF